jgi:hypothetical protein
MALDNWSEADPDNGIPKPGEGNTYWVGTDLSETYSTDSSAAEVVYFVDWSVRAQFIEDLLGYAQLSNYGNISRVLPEQHPELENFFATDISKVQSWGVDSDDTGFVNIPLAKITASFRPLSYALVADQDLPETDSNIPDETQRYCTFAYEPHSELLQVGLGGFKFCTQINNANPVLQQPPSILTGSIGLKIIWHQVPTKYDPQDTTRQFCPPTQFVGLQLAGTVNEYTFLGYSPGTVLYLGMQPRLVMPRFGDPAFAHDYHFEIEYSFLIRDNGESQVQGDTDPEGNQSQCGHNYLWQPKLSPARYDLVTSGPNAGDPDGDRMYQYADLYQLFQITNDS